MFPHCHVSLVSVYCNPFAVCHLVIRKKKAKEKENMMMKTERLEIENMRSKIERMSGCR